MHMKLVVKNKQSLQEQIENNYFDLFIEAYLDNDKDIIREFIKKDRSGVLKQILSEADATTAPAQQPGQTTQTAQQVEERLKYLAGIRKKK